MWIQLPTRVLGLLPSCTACIRNVAWSFVSYPSLWTWSWGRERKREKIPWYIFVVSLHQAGLFIAYPTGLSATYEKQWLAPFPANQRHKNNHLWIARILFPTLLAIYELFQVRSSYSSGINVVSCMRNMYVQKKWRERKPWALKKCNPHCTICELLRNKPVTAMKSDLTWALRWRFYMPDTKITMIFPCICWRFQDKRSSTLNLLVMQDCITPVLLVTSAMREYCRWIPGMSKSSNSSNTSSCLAFLCNLAFPIKYNIIVG